MASCLAEVLHCSDELAPNWHTTIMRIKLCQGKMRLTLFYTFSYLVNVRGKNIIFTGLERVCNENQRDCAQAEWFAGQHL